MSVNYTEEQVEVMKAWYKAEPTRETVEKLSMELNKSIKSCYFIYFYVRHI